MTIERWSANAAQRESSEVLQQLSVSPPSSTTGSVPPQGPREPAGYTPGSLSNMLASGHVPSSLLRVTGSAGVNLKQVQEHGVADLNALYGFRQVLVQYTAEQQADTRARIQHMHVHRRTRGRGDSHGQPFAAPTPTRPPGVPAPQEEEEAGVPVPPHLLDTVAAAETIVMPVAPLLLQGVVARRRQRSAKEAFRQWAQGQTPEPPPDPAADNQGFWFQRAAIEALAALNVRCSLSHLHGTVLLHRGDEASISAAVQLNSTLRAIIASDTPAGQRLLRHPPYHSLSHCLDDVLPDREGLLLWGDVFASASQMPSKHLAKHRSRLSGVLAQLRLYTNCYIQAQRSQSTYGRFFSSASLLSNIARILTSQKLVTKHDTFVDFSAGHNDFGGLLGAARWVGFDLYPPKTRQHPDHFRRVNWFNVTRLPQNCVVGLNPPFGQNGSFAVDFLEHTMRVHKPKLIVCILPGNTPWQAPAKAAGYELLRRLPDLCGGSAFYIPGTALEGASSKLGGEGSNLTIGPRVTPSLIILQRADGAARRAKP